MVFLVWGRDAENIQKKYKESQITTIHIFGFTFYIKNHTLLEKHITYHHILFTVFMRCRVFETS